LPQSVKTLAIKRRQSNSNKGLHHGGMAFALVGPRAENSEAHRERTATMAISFDNALGVHEKALLIREQRAELIANNLANVDTPNFKARDLDFKSLVRDAIASRANASGGAGMQRTNAGHVSLEGPEAPGSLLYRVPMQPSLDGNTVDENIEMANFSRNSLDFQASLTFLQSSLRGLKTALRGE
jgi:flagellar basal-body rod protein FlgB